MPLDGSGNASKPSGTTASPNTTIESAKWNSVIDDIYSILNTARPITKGGTGATSASAARTALGLAIGTDVQAYNAGLTSVAAAWVPASASGPASLDFAEDTDNGTNRVRVIAPASIASDKTVTFQDITGTLYVTGGQDVSVADGGTGLSTLTANNVILGNGTSAPLFVAPGASGNVLTSNGTTWTSAAAASGGLTLLGTITTTSGSSQSLTSIPTGYVYLFLKWTGVSVTGASTTITVAASSTNGAAYGAGGGISNVNAADFVNGGMYIYNYTSTVAAGKVVSSALRNSSGAGADPGVAAADTNTAAALNAIRVSTSTGTFDAGSIDVYGVK